MAEDVLSGKDLSSQADEMECPACGSSKVDDSIPSVDPVCTECGAVISAELDVGDTVAGPEENKATTWSEHYTVTNSTEQQVASAFEFLEELGNRLDVSNEVRERAAERYGEAAIEKATDGRPTEAVVAGALVVAGRELKRPYPIGRIAEAADIEVRTLRRALSALRRDLLLNIVCPPEAYLVELVPLLGLDSSINSVAEQVLDEVPSHQVGGKHPAAVAGAALYLSADGEITQREVAEVTGVTTETIRVRVKECRESTSPELSKRNW